MISFNRKPVYISYRKTRFIVFWSKNPYPLLTHLDELDRLHIGCYIHYTLNDYEEERLEKNVPPLEYRIQTFQQLVDRLGVGHVIWRFDPLILSDRIDINQLLQKIQYIGDRLQGYTEKLVFSFADIAIYRKVARNLLNNGFHISEWQEEEMKKLAVRLSAMNRERNWNYELASCGEKIDLTPYGISHNHCIDYSLMVRLAPDDADLMHYIDASIHTRKQNLFGEPEPLPATAIVLPDGRYTSRDSGQRDACGCMRSKDIGAYNTCIHHCEYCYANASKEIAIANFKKHQEEPWGDRI